MSAWKKAKEIFSRASSSKNEKYAKLITIGVGIFFVITFIVLLAVFIIAKLFVRF